MNRRLNRELLKELLNDKGLAEASLATDVGISTLEKLRGGSYTSRVTLKTMRKLCGGLNVSLDALFPSVDAGEKKAS